ncbi:MAG: 2-C-methyl-D-erythritol 4-phosphate cytidylyltransferase, partial [Pseudomonadota bacterium]|nr:2-C-methyl-D-erythritol 4-phosphate cytidylyltransferase [Pseudomonadota bacterium]
MKTSALIVAAGRGTRAGGEIPKQYQPLLGRAVLSWTIERFVRHPAIDEIIVVL